MTEDCEILVGFYNCCQCKREKISGDDMMCPGCGAARGEDVQFYYADDAELVTDERKIAAAKAGPDWNCGYCGAGNPAGRKACRQCNAPRGGSKLHDVSRDLLSAPEPERAPVHRPAPIKPQAPVYVAPPAPPSPPPVSHVARAQVERPRQQPTRDDFVSRPSTPAPDFPFVGALLTVAVIILVICGLCSLFTPKDVELRVSSVSWQRSISLEKYVTLTEDGWSVPSGGRSKTVESRHHHDDQVVDHHKTVEDYATREVFDHYGNEAEVVTERYQSGTERYCTGTQSLGNGKFKKSYSTRPTYGTRSKTTHHQVKVTRPERYLAGTHQEAVYRAVPRYQDWYTYDIDRWTPSRTERSSGSNGNPEWPKWTAAGQERECGRTEDYAVSLTSVSREKPQAFTLKPALAEWQKFKTGDLYKAKVTMTGALTELQKSGVESSN